MLFKSSEFTKSELIALTLATLGLGLILVMFLERKKEKIVETPNEQKK